MSTTRRNIIANYTGSIVLMLGPLIALPWYLSTLGPTQFGFISFITTLQGLLTLLECGISQVCSRDFAVRLNKEKPDYRSAAQLLLGIERIYWFAAVFAGAAMVLLADTIISQWLTLDSETNSLGKHAVYGAAVIFIFQFPGGLYRNFLANADEQVTLNSILVSGMLVRHIVGVSLLFVSPTLTTYLLWQMISTGIETSIRRYTAWKVVNADKSKPIWRYEIVRPVLLSSWKMSGAVILGPLTTQLDRIFLSRMVSIEQLGYYTIASTLAIAILQLIHPLVQALSPKIMQSTSSPSALRRINIQLMLSILMVVVIGALVYTLAGRDILKVWLRNSETVAIVYPFLSILLLGSALNAFYHVGYYNWLALDKARMIFIVNLISFIVCLIVTPILIGIKGPIGATFGFVTMNIIGFLMSLGWLKKERAINI